MNEVLIQILSGLIAVWLFSIAVFLFDLIIWRVFYTPRYTFDDYFLNGWYGGVRASLKYPVYLFFIIIAVIIIYVTTFFINAKLQGLL